MPGSVISQMPPQDDDPQRKQRDLERQTREQSSARTGEAMQIGAGGIVVTDGGSITISGTGALHVGSGALDSAGSISAATDITAGGTVQGAAIVSTGSASVAGSLSAGSVSSGDVASSGQVSSALPLKSVGTFGYLVANNYQSVWQDGDTFQLGYSPSSTVVKTALTPMTDTDVQKLLGLTAYWGRYIWDAEDVPPRVFLLAADVQAAGFGPDVAPVVTGDEPLVMIGTDGKPILDTNGNQCTVPIGEAYTINYSQLVVPLLAGLQSLAARIAALEAKA